jgi:tetratricopeptide (TPR) repeat protein
MGRWVMRKIFVYVSISAVMVVLVGCATQIDYALTAKTLTEEKGQHDEAIKNAKQGIALNPQYAPNWYWMGIAYYRKGNYDEAISAFKKVIELKPDGVQYQSSFYFLGTAYYLKGNYDEAIRDLNRAIENTNQNDKVALMTAIRGKAFSYLGLGDKETALNLIKQAKSASDYNNNHDLSLIYYAIGDKEKAWEYRGGKGMVGIQVKDYKKGNSIGAEVVKTIAGGPAEKTGILTGDVIVEADGIKITSGMDFLGKTRTLIPGIMLKIKVLREGIEKDINFEVASAETLMELDPNIAPILAKKKGKPETVASTPASISKSDVDELPAIKAKPNKNYYAIVIGIESYRQKLPKADFAAQDAKTVTEYLTKVMGYPEENVVTLLNEHATNVDFAKYFEKWLPNNAEKDGSVFIYYSGHGAPNPKTGDAYLVPYDGDPSFIDETGYPLKRLYDSLGKLQAKEIIVALDSCFSGAGGRSVIAKGSRPLVMTMEKSAIPSNTAVLSAASGEQISSTYEEKGHGLFTYFMLKGLKGEGDTNGDGKVEIGELFEYLKPQVERIARKTYNNEQLPQLIAPAEIIKQKLIER